MAKDPLKIISVASDTGRDPKRNRKQATAEKFEKLWSVNPDQFNPEKNCMGRERILRTKMLMNEFFDAKGKNIADLGCGSGTLSLFLADQGANVTAVDIANNALKIVKDYNKNNILVVQDYIPNTKLNDESYDAVLSTELIAYLYPDQYRLYFSELARILNPTGFIVCSTPLDIYSEDALTRFAALVDTEFKVEKWVYSYHALYIRIHNMLKTPSRFSKARKDPEYREKECNKRRGFSKHWFHANSNPMIGTIWAGINWTLQPLINYYMQSRKVLIGLENICRFIWSESGISHVAFIGKRRALIEPEPEKDIPIERKQKKQVWE